MQTSISQILSQLRNVELKFSTLYHNISTIQKQFNPRISTVCSVLSAEEKKHADKYSALILEYEAKDFLDIEEGLLYNITSIIREFSQKIERMEDGSISQILSTAITYENKNADIIKMIIKAINSDTRNNHTEMLSLFNHLLAEEIKHSNNLKQFL